MKTFFILYWGTLLMGYLTYRSYTHYYRRSILRRIYAERHKSRLKALNGRNQMTLFSGYVILRLDRRIYFLLQFII
ncbi:MAG: hypothetical protein WCW30_01195 [Candidatus Gracilibacteria bacterium]